MKKNISILFLKMDCLLYKQLFCFFICIFLSSNLRCNDINTNKKIISCPVLSEVVSQEMSFEFGNEWKIDDNINKLKANSVSHLMIEKEQEHISAIIIVKWLKEKISPLELEKKFLPQIVPNGTIVNKSVKHLSSPRNKGFVILYESPNRLAAISEHAPQTEIALLFLRNDGYLIATLIVGNFIKPAIVDDFIKVIEDAKIVNSASHSESRDKFIIDKISCINFIVDSDSKDKYEVSFPLTALLYSDKYVKGSPYTCIFRTVPSAYWISINISTEDQGIITKEYLEELIVKLNSGKIPYNNMHPSKVSKKRFWGYSCIFKNSSNEKKYEASAFLYLDNKFLISIDISDIPLERIDILLGEIFSSLENAKVSLLENKEAASQRSSVGEHEVTDKDKH